MPNENILTLRQADQARTDFALIESNLQFIMGQIARLPSRVSRLTQWLRLPCVVLIAAVALRIAW